MSRGSGGSAISSDTPEGPWTYAVEKSLEAGRNTFMSTVSKPAVRAIAVAADCQHARQGRFAGAAREVQQHVQRADRRILLVYDLGRRQTFIGEHVIPIGISSKASQSYKSGTVYPSSRNSESEGRAQRVTAPRGGPGVDGLV